LQITTLIDNRPSPDDHELTAEWGLSLCVELNGRHILIDMGASDAFARNAERLSVDIAAIDVAILSHHHYDHGGGLRRFLELNHHAPIYLGAAPGRRPDREAARLRQEIHRTRPGTARAARASLPLSRTNAPQSAPGRVRAPNIRGRTRDPPATAGCT
jgi:metal-dependent hydrolase (beta-lactamase superfamily II)